MSYDPGREALAFLRKESLDLFNRIHSIDEDVSFVDKVHEAYPDVPILPNLRCGAWYTDPTIATDCPAYFKSTDGHFSNWSFNLRRPNLHLLPLIAAQDGTGIILVDSTRAGKRIPDALSKTVPIWCAVVNRAVLQVHPGKVGWDTNLYTPPGAVSSQEHDQIEQRLDAWANALANSSYDLPDLRLPLRPMWLTPASSGFPVFPAKKDRTFVPILCLSASRQVQVGVERRSGGFAYIQGSGDDHELWGMGLTPDMFWAHRAVILNASRAQLQTLVASIVATQSRAHVGRLATPIKKVHGRVLVCATTDLPPDPKDWDKSMGHVVIGAGPSVKLPDSSSILCIETWEGKKGQMQFLQDVLPRSTSFLHAQLLAGRRVCITCDTGTDFSVGIALVALQKFFDDGGELVVSGDHAAKDKHSIRTRLEWIITSRPEANPSRTTLKRVNEFLLSSSSFRAPSSRPFPSQTQISGEAPP
ncbi:initiator tRNA phosphoribosyl transferase [Mycena latifolia]|nr:initiator tRNA phosphoribosyl transferase [Mycena latifolia]